MSGDVSSSSVLGLLAALSDRLSGTTTNNRDSLAPQSRVRASRGAFEPLLNFDSSYETPELAFGSLHTRVCEYSYALRQFGLAANAERLDEIVARTQAWTGVLAPMLVLLLELSGSQTPLDVSDDSKERVGWIRHEDLTRLASGFQRDADARTDSIIVASSSPLIPSSSSSSSLSRPTLTAAQPPLCSSLPPLCGALDPPIRPMGGVGGDGVSGFMLPGGGSFSSLPGLGTELPALPAYPGEEDTHTGLGQQHTHRLGLVSAESVRQTASLEEMYTAASMVVVGQHAPLVADTHAHTHTHTYTRAWGEEAHAQTSSVAVVAPPSSLPSSFVVHWAGVKREWGADLAAKPLAQLAPSTHMHASSSSSASSSEIIGAVQPRTQRGTYYLPLSRVSTSQRELAHQHRAFSLRPGGHETPVVPDAAVVASALAMLQGVPSGVFVEGGDRTLRPIKCRSPSGGAHNASLLQALCVDGNCFLALQRLARDLSYSNGFVPRGFVSGMQQYLRDYTQRLHKAVSAYTRASSFSSSSSLGVSSEDASYALWLHSCGRVEDDGEAKHTHTTYDCGESSVYGDVEGMDLMALSHATESVRQELAWLLGVLTTTTTTLSSSPSPCSSASLLSVLFAHMRRSGNDARKLQVCQDMFTAAAAPYMRIVTSFVYGGVLDDPHSEFFVERRDPSDGEGREFCMKRGEDGERSGANVNAVPLFLQGLEESILQCGQSISILRRGQHAYYDACFLPEDAQTSPRLPAVALMGLRGQLSAADALFDAPPDRVVRVGDRACHSALHRERGAFPLDMCFTHSQVEQLRGKAEDLLTQQQANLAALVEASLARRADRQAELQEHLDQQVAQRALVNAVREKRAQEVEQVRVDEQRAFREGLRRQRDEKRVLLAQEIELERRELAQRAAIEAERRSVIDRVKEQLLAELQAIRDAPVVREEEVVEEEDPLEGETADERASARRARFQARLLEQQRVLTQRTARTQLFAELMEQHRNNARRRPESEEYAELTAYMSSEDADALVALKKRERELELLGLRLGRELEEHRAQEAEARATLKNTLERGEGRKSLRATTTIPTTSTATALAVRTETPSGAAVSSSPHTQNTDAQKHRVAKQQQQQQCSDHRELGSGPGLGAVVVVGDVSIERKSAAAATDGSTRTGQTTRTGGDRRYTQQQQSSRQQRGHSSAPRASSAFYDAHNQVTSHVTRAMRVCVDRQAQGVGVVLLRCCFDEWALLQHLTGLREVLLMHHGDMMSSFCHKLHKSITTEGATAKAVLHPGNLDALLAGSMEACGYTADAASSFFFSCDHAQLAREPGPGENARVAMAVSDRVLDAIRLHYRVGFPLSTVLTKESLEGYSDVFGFMLRLRRVNEAIKGVWRRFSRDAKAGRVGAGVDRRQGAAQRLLQVALREMMYVVDVLQGFVMTQVIHVSWADFSAALRQCSSVEGVRRAHEEYVRRAKQACFLTDKGAMARKIISSMFQSILHFSALVRARKSPCHEWDRDAVQQASTHIDKYRQISTFLLRIVRALAQNGKTDMAGLYTRLDFNRFFERTTEVH